MGYRSCVSGTFLLGIELRASEDDSFRFTSEGCNGSCGGASDMEPDKESDGEVGSDSEPSEGRTIGGIGDKGVSWLGCGSSGSTEKTCSESQPLLCLLVLAVVVGTRSLDHKRHPQVFYGSKMLQDRSVQTPHHERAL